MKTIFLGGTCADSKWRNDFIKLLDKTKIKYFNPVVYDWNEEARINEIKHRENDDYMLYVLSRAYSTYSIAEVVDDSNKRPNKTICCIISEEDKPLSKQEFKHLNQVGKMVERNGVNILLH